MAQSVERRIGSAEVTGPIPVSSFADKNLKSFKDAGKPVNMLFPAILFIRIMSNILVKVK